MGVTTEHAFGSLEYYADSIRQASVRSHDNNAGTYVATVGIIQALSEMTRSFTAAERLDHIRTALAAADLVRAEAHALQHEPPTDLSWVGGTTVGL
jgi:hypothetical protein